MTTRRPASDAETIEFYGKQAREFIDGSDHVPTHAEVMAYLVDPKRGWLPPVEFNRLRAHIATVVTAILEPAN